jgi:hypothetical protein
MCMCVCAGITAVGTCMVNETLGVCEIRPSVEVGYRPGGGRYCYCWKNFDVRVRKVLLCCYTCRIV